MNEIWHLTNATGFKSRIGFNSSLVKQVVRIWKIYFRLEKNFSTFADVLLDMCVGFVTTVYPVHLEAYLVMFVCYHQALNKEACMATLHLLKNW